INRSESAWQCRSLVLEVQKLRARGHFFNPVPRRPRVDRALEKRQVKRAYKFYAPAYDFVFDWIFHQGREQAMRLLDVKRNDHVREGGVGSAFDLPMYPH